MIALVDCNNFFVSVERVFEPSLSNRAVAVLSSNDGCIIARSNEVKALGIPMGAPVFKVQHLLDKHRVVLKSSNFPLYSDMSRRVMSVLERFSPSVDVYSIDEAFLDWPQRQEPRQLCDAVLREVGIPVTIGIASTHALAKAAAFLGKRGEGVMDWSRSSDQEVDVWLQRVPLDDVWGIGRQLHRKLQLHRIRTAYDLKHMPDELLRGYDVNLRRLVSQLRGQMIAHHEPAPSKSMVGTRSFGKVVSEKSELSQSLSHHAAHLGEKLRREGLYASSVTAFISTGQGGSSLTGERTLAEPTQGSRALIAAANQILEECFDPNLHYKKAGVMVYGLRQLQQLTLTGSEGVIAQDERIGGLMDEVNAKWGGQTIKFGAEGIGASWRPRHELRSPRYTTEWSELKVVK